MRRLLIGLLLLIGLALPAQAQTVAGSHAVAGGGTPSLTVTAGDLLVVSVAGQAGGIPSITSITGSLNGAYTTTGCSINGNDFGPYAFIFYRMNSGAGTETVTVTGANLNAHVITLYRLTGAATASALDGCQSSNNAVGVNHPHGTLSSTAAGIFITSLGFDGLDCCDAISPGTNYAYPDLVDGETADSYYLRGWSTYRISATSLASQTGQITTVQANSSSAGVIAAFKAAGGGGTTAPKRLLLFRVGDQ